MYKNTVFIMLFDIFFRIIKNSFGKYHQNPTKSLHFKMYICIFFYRELYLKTIYRGYMNKFQLYVLLLFAVCIANVTAQETLLPAGGDASGTGGSSSYSVGQITYSYDNAQSKGSSSQGVQHPYEFFTVGVDDNKEISLSLTVFPNPTQSVVNLKIENQSLEHLSFQLFDAKGEQLLTQIIQSENMQIPMSSLASGMYLLKILNGTTTVKTFTIIKHT